MGPAGPYLLVLLAVTAVIHAGFAVYAWRQRAASGAAVFSLLNLAMAVWLTGYAGELIAIDLETKVIWAKTEYFGIVTVPVLWLLYALDVRGWPRWLNRRWTWALWVLPAITLAMVWTTAWHGQHWRTTALSGPDVLAAITVTYGPWFWIHSAYSYIAILLGTALFVIHVSRSTDLYRGQAVLLVAGAFMPWVANIAYLAGLIPIPGLDPTPIAFSLSALALGIDIARYRLLDIMPVARLKVLTTMLEAVIVVDPGGRIVEANPSARALLDTRARVGDTLSQAAPAWPELLAFAAEPGEGDTQLPLGAVRMFEARRALLSDGPERASGRLLVLREITQTLQAARELARARDEALEASRLKSQLLAKVSHELRTPLGAIIGYSEMMQSGAYGELTERGHAAAERVIHSANYLAHLVDDLLDQARLEAGRIRLDPQDTDVRAMLLPLVAQIGDQTREAGLVFEHHIADSVPQRVVIDGSRLQQIAFNLLNNALKYTARGEIVFIVDVVPAIAPPTPQSLVNDLRLTVRDTGVGISAEALAHIFEPFWQADHELTGKRSGYGLGLAIVAELLRLMGGSITVDSAAEKGSIFTVRLPLQPVGSTEAPVHAIS